MKMTSGVRLNERRTRALVRLQASTFEGSRIVRRKCDLASKVYWTEMRDTQVATLKKLTGQLFS